MRLTAPLAVRGGKNSSENQCSPDSILLRILSRSLSVRSVSSTGVEHRELSLELSPPLLLAPLESLLHDCQLPSPRWTWFTIIADYTERNKKENTWFQLCSMISDICYVTLTANLTGCSSNKNKKNQKIKITPVNHH